MDDCEIEEFEEFDDERDSWCDHKRWDVKNDYWGLGRRKYKGLVICRDCGKILHKQENTICGSG